MTPNEDDDHFTEIAAWRVENGNKSAEMAVIMLGKKSAAYLKDDVGVVDEIERRQRENPQQISETLSAANWFIEE